MSATPTPRRVARLWAMLRSRRIAIWLLVGVSGYLALTTVVSIPRAFSNPVFLLAAGILTASTGACAWERTRHARTRSPRLPQAEDPHWREVLGRPTFSIPLQEGASVDEPLRGVRLAMSQMRLHESERDGIISGTANSLGRWGSPVFHWALCGLFLFAALGQLTRAEGLMNIAVGESLPDVPASYVAGPPVAPLFLGRYTGALIGVERIDREHETGGGAKDAAPLVTIARNGTLRARQWVYPNAPARYRSLTIHRQSTGPAMLLSLSFPGGQEATAVAFFPPITEAQGENRATLDVSNKGAGVSYTIEFERRPGAKVVARVRGTSYQSPALAAGDDAMLPDGTTVRIARLTSYAQLRVVNDWSLPYVFVLFSIVVFGASLALLVPTRHAIVWIAETGDRLDVRVSQRRNDPAFSHRLERALRQTVHVDESECEVAR